MARSVRGANGRGRDEATRRSQILRAARALIAEHGVAGTTIRMLGTRVGVTEGALYRHFPSKEAIIGELVTHEAALFHDRLAAALASAGVGAPTADPWLQLDTLVAGFIEFGRSEPDSFRIIMELHGSPGARFNPRGRKPRTLFLDAIARIQDGGSARRTGAAAIAVMIVGLLSRLIIAERANELDLTPAEVVHLAQRSTRAVVGAACSPEDPRGTPRTGR